jgi:hypothetical protein
MNTKQRYYPELISRKGELIAWSSFLMASITWLILSLYGAPIHTGLRFLSYFLLGSSLMISFGNWMDRKTILQIDDEGISFQNGLRKVRLEWNAIQQIDIFSSRWGKKVCVSGTELRFNFRTFGEVNLHGKEKGRMGFEKGEEIIKIIIERTGLEGIGQAGSNETYKHP